MFHDMPPSILERMAYMEAVDARDRQDGTPTAYRLRQIPPETGRFLALLAALSPRGAVLEIGTSGGYSGLWLALACRQRGDRLITFETTANKVSLAQETFRLALVQEIVQIVQGDATQLLPRYADVAFCFLDIEKDTYRKCYDQVLPNLVPGGIFCADNVISHALELAPFLESVASDSRVDSLVVPIGKGILVCRKV
jgi:predicted O-methyltransferase YrrM